MEIRQKPRQPVEGEFYMAVKRMATLLFLGAVTMLLLGALVYLAATSGRPKRQPVPHSEGVELLRAGTGAPGQPSKQTVAPAYDFSVLP